MTVSGDERLLALGLNAADSAAQLMLNQGGIQVWPKGDRDEVSSKDLQIERGLRRLLTAGRVRGFLGEEDGHSGSTAEYWVADPVDGTVNYTHGIPLNGLSLALVRDGVPVIGVIILPFLGYRYWARAGHGAYRDGLPIGVSAARSLHEAIIAVGDFDTSPDARRLNGERLEVMRLLAASALRVRMAGTAAGDLAWTADGRLGGMVTLCNRPWDMAAGAVILAEAGALACDADGRPYTLESAEIIAGPPVIARELAALVRDARHAIARPAAAGAA